MAVKYETIRRLFESCKLMNILELILFIISYQNKLTGLFAIIVFPVMKLSLKKYNYVIKYSALNILESP